eukprot:1786140-Pyramimonas_sp.AAC.1
MEFSDAELNHVRVARGTGHARLQSCIGGPVRAGGGSSQANIEGDRGPEMPGAADAVLTSSVCHAAL